MSLLSIAQAVARQAKIPTPTTVYGNTNLDAELLFSCADEAVRALARRPFVNLIREYTFTTTTDANYALPDDYQSMVDGTVWDRSQYQSIRGGLSPAEWQAYKSSIIANSAGLTQRYRLRFNTTTNTRQFYLDPTPSAGRSLVLEYRSKYPVLSGSTRVETWTADTDTAVIDEWLVRLETKWRTLERQGMAFAQAQNEAITEINRALGSDQPPQTLSLSRAPDFRFVDWQNVPDTGIGQ